MVGYTCEYCWKWVWGNNDCSCQTAIEGIREALNNQFQKEKELSIQKRLEQIYIVASIRLHVSSTSTEVLDFIEDAVKEKLDFINQEEN